MTPDPDLDPATSVLRNLLGISDENALRAVEADVTAAVLLRLSQQVLPGGYDLATFGHSIARSLARSTRGQARSGRWR